MKLISILFGLLMTVYSLSCYGYSDVFEAENLKCEHLPTPIGIDTYRPRFSWMLKDSRYGAKQTAYRIVVGTNENEVINGVGDFWDSGKVSSEDILVVYDGKKLSSFFKLYWSVQIWDKDGVPSYPKVTFFETGIMEKSEWKGFWISDGNSINKKEAPYFRNEIGLTKEIADARIYIATAGLYELFVNGSRIGDHCLDPMFTRFDRRILYVSYDVTEVLRNGTNAIGVIIGNGWYNHQTWTVWGFNNSPWRNRPAFRMNLRVSYVDGSCETIYTDDNWKTSDSPIVFNSIYAGEHYDARKEKFGWDKVGYDDSDWKQAKQVEAPTQNVVAQQLWPIREVEKVIPVSVKKISERVFVFDLGRNISGVSEFKIRGERGKRFVLKHGELLNPDGTVDISNINEYQRTDPAYPHQGDIYTLSGLGDEVFKPHFNYKGFQYVEVSSDEPFELTIDNVTGYFMHSDVPSIGMIRTSSEIINKIWQSTNNSYLSNLFGYPTDCPQREKVGWTGDAQIAVETGLYNFDAITIYEKWLADHRDEQMPDGVLPSIIPTNGNGWGYGDSNAPDYVSTIATIPWYVYLFYGDNRLLLNCFENIKRYVDHLTGENPSMIIDWGVGDHAPVSDKPSLGLTSTIYFYLDAKILAEAARMLGKEDEYYKYRMLADKIKDAINVEYLDSESGIYDNGKQTALSVPVFWDIVPEEMRRKVVDNLAHRVIADALHIDVGMQGSKAVLSALSDNGYADLAFSLASQETFPSWGHWITNGATTLFEQWDMTIKNSKNHIIFGDISAWFFRSLGGISPDPHSPGFKKILLRPSFVNGLDFFESEFISPYGRIVSSWKRIGDNIVYDITVPANTTAKLRVAYDCFDIEQLQIVGVDEVPPDSMVKGIDGLYHFLAGTYRIRISPRVFQ